VSVRRPPPGVQLSSGRIRVDAARAIAKLREYRLADPSAWILEAVRAAVGSGATRIALDGDADDVRLVWEGPAWPAATLPELFDELVSPEAARDVYPRRLLAGAVNSALGLEPAWIDVVSVSGGTAARVRFTPAIVTPGEDGAAPLRDLDVETVPVPYGAADPGMYVQLHRRVSLETVGRFLTGGEAPELGLARWAGRDLPVPFLVGGKDVARGEHHDDVVRVELGENLDGFVAVVHPQLLRGRTSVPAMDVAELGVRVVRERWTPSTLEAAWSQDRAPLPVRLVINGPRMPTNASRSQVRRDDHPIAAALRRGDQQVEALVGELARRFTDAGDREIMRHAALALLAPAIAGVTWSEDATALPRPLSVLAKLPLVRNALGDWRAPAEYWRGPVFRGDGPVARELSPWLATMPWIPPGDAAEILLGASKPDAREARRAIKAAVRRLGARKAFMAQPVQDARVAPRAESRVRAKIAAVLQRLEPRAAFEGLDGEVCVAHAPGPGRMTIHYEDRPLATAVLDTPLAIEAVVTGARIVPDERYRGVAADGELRRAESAVRIAAIRAIEALAGDAAHPGVEVSAPRGRSGSDDALLLVALAMARESNFRVEDHSPLATAGLFVSRDGLRHSLAELRRETAVAVIAAGAQVTPPPGRLMITATAAEQMLLTRLLAPATAVVPYDGPYARPPLDPGLVLARAIAARTGAVALVKREGAFGGAIGIAPSDHSTLTTYHRGKSLELVAREPAHVDCAIAIDSEAVVPSADWSKVWHDGGIGRLDLAGWERELVRATVRALLGDPEPDLVIPQRPVRIEDATGQALCVALADGDPEELLGTELLVRLRSAEIWTALGGDGGWSIDRLRGAFGDDIPAIHEGELLQAAEIEGWHPLVGGPLVRRVVARLSGRAVVDASAEIVRHLRTALRRRKLADHRARPAEPLELPAACAPVALAGDVRGVVGIGEANRLEAVVLVEGRRFARVVSTPDLPLRAVVELSIEAVDLERGEVGAIQNGRVLAAVRAGAAAWLAQIAAARPEMLADDEPTRELLGRWLTQAGDDHRAVRDALRSARAWRTIQGGRASLAAAVNGPSIPTASWSGEWLNGDPADALDGPVLALSAGRDGDVVRVILDEIGPWQTHDVTPAVLRLQARRRVLSGKVPSPTVEGAARELTRRFDELDVHHTLGVGEVALDDAATSHALLHFEGQLRATLPLDVVPAVKIAFEAPDLVDAMKSPGGMAAAHKEQLARQVQALALALVTQVAIAAERGVSLPAWLRRRLASAVLAQRLEPERVTHVPLFTTLAGTLMTWNDVLAQETLLGDVWFLVGEPPGQPLDNRRRVVTLSAEDAALASRMSGRMFVDGSRELALDAQARINRARAPLARLELPAAVRGAAMGVAELTTTASGRRGIVAALRPGAVGLRGLHACRGMVPFERAADPCVWPTYAIVEDPELRGDRTWKRAAEDEVWTALGDDVRTTSRMAIRSWLAAPADALASELVEEWHVDRDTALWDASLVRGVVWIDALAGAGGGRGLVTVSTPHGDVEIDAPPEAPLWGRLYTAPEPRGLVQAVRAICRARHEAMARRAGVWREPVREPEVDAQGVHPGGRTRKRSGTGWTPGIELRAEAPPREWVPPPDQEWDPEPPPKPKAEPPPHTLERLVAAVRARLTEGAPIGVGSNAKIDAAREAPPVQFESGRLVFAGRSELLVAVNEGRDDKAPWAAAAIDALAAHCMSLINLAHTPVDDRQERAAIEHWLTSAGHR
jgi:hypothetical protein